MQFVNDLTETILYLKGSDDHIVVVTPKKGYVFDSSLNLQVVADITTEFDFTLQSAFAENNLIYLGTEEFGILQRSFSNPTEHLEIHPKGPTSNECIFYNC